MEIKNLRYALRVYPTIHHYLNIYDAPTFVVYMLISHFLGVSYRAFSSVYNRYKFTRCGHYWTLLSDFLKYYFLNQIFYDHGQRVYSLVFIFSLNKPGFVSFGAIHLKVIF